MFRSSRPDYIETALVRSDLPTSCLHCSGLPDRTTLRLSNLSAGASRNIRLFRSSRPDYIETKNSTNAPPNLPVLFRSSRPDYIETLKAAAGSTPVWTHCSGLPDRTTLRPASSRRIGVWPFLLFRSSRPDYIETSSTTSFRFHTQTLFRSSRPDYIETRS